MTSEQQLRRARDRILRELARLTRDLERLRAALAQAGEIQRVTPLRKGRR